MIPGPYFVGDYSTDIKFPDLLFWSIDFFISVWSMCFVVVVVVMGFFALYLLSLESKFS